MSLTRKIAFALIVVLIGSMAGVAAFTYDKFGEVHDDLVRSRYSFVIFTIKRKVEDGLNLGLALKQARQMQEVIEQEKARDFGILGIEIYDSAGTILFSTDRGATGDAEPAAWLSPLTNAANSQPFSLADEDALVVGLPLVSGFGRVEGAVALRYPLDYGRGTLTTLMSRSAPTHLAVMAGFAVLAALGAKLILGGFLRPLAAAGALLDGVRQGKAPPPAPAENESCGFDGRLAEFAAKTHEAITHMRDASDEVERLDRLA